jgi:methionyl-tRNA formyltransferase
VETGVTVIQMSPRIDAGGCLAKARLAIDPDETAIELEARLAELGAPLVLQSIDQLEAGTIHPLPQDPALATKAPRLKKSDGIVNWSRSAREIKNQVRALEPWPKTYTFWLRSGHEPLRLILGKVTAIEGDTHPLPGTVVHAHKTDLIVSTGDGLIRIESLQPAGKRMLPVEEFLRGYPVEPGERFSDAGDSI